MLICQFIVKMDINETSKKLFNINNQIFKMHFFFNLIVSVEICLLQQQLNVFS